MKVRDVYKSRPIGLQTITPEASVQDAIRQLNRFNIGGLPVCDTDGDLVGIITERDICLLYTSPSPRDATLSRMPSSA